MTTLVGVRRALLGDASSGSISQGGGPGIPNPQFWLPLSDAGSGAVNLNAYRAAPGTAATFLRATSATCWSSAGLLLTVATGVARSNYTELTGATYLGLLSEGSATNEVLWNRDLTNVAWTKVTTTAAKDQTGIDGSANAASSLTASAGNGTTLQVITEASTTRTFSVYIKRITGTGEIDVTENGGTAWTNVTGLINSSTYSRVTLTSAALNPSVGFRIVTNGDKIAVDYVQNETGSGATSPIATTTVAVARNPDVLTYPATGNLIATVGSAYLKFSGGVQSTQENLFSLSPAGGGVPLYLHSSNELRLFDGIERTLGLLPTRPIASPTKLATSWGGATCSGSVSGSLTSGLTFDGDLNGTATMSIGGNSDGSVHASGSILDFKVFTAKLLDAQLASL
jgi:hypothetical protein